MTKFVKKLTISIIKLSDYSIIYSHKYYHVIPIPAFYHQSKTHRNDTEILDKPTDI